jgi:hypothetical protein
VRCYFPNYVYYKWQKSTDGGSTWIETGVNGVGSPTLVGGQWEYTAAYPTFIATMADSGQRYRAVVATTPANLSTTNCSYNNNASTFLNIINCGVVLNINLKSFAGEVLQSNANLTWSIAQGSNIDYFEIEKSANGINFTTAGKLSAGNTLLTTLYKFNDLEKLSGLGYYRLKLVEHGGLFSYSPIITLTTKKIDFEIKSVSNPVTDNLVLDFTVPSQSKVHIQLLDIFGHPIYQRETEAKKGWNKIKLDFTRQLPGGVYVLTVTNNNQTINKRIIRMK